MKTKLEVINETVAYYSEDVSRRSKGASGQCYYGRDLGGSRGICMCALGRYIDPKHHKATNAYKCSGSAYDFFYGFGFEILKEEVRHIKESKFWKDLQELHDIDVNWNKDGLTENGRLTVETLKKIHK